MSDVRWVIWAPDLTTGRARIVAEFTAPDRDAAKATRAAHHGQTRGFLDSRLDFDATHRARQSREKAAANPWAQRGRGAA